MSRTFAYSRCSTNEQNTDNQFSVIQGKGYDIPEYRQIAEIVSGGVPAKQRPKFSKLLEKLEPRKRMGAPISPLYL